MKPRPNSTQGSTYMTEVGCGKLYITIAQAEDYNEIFLRLGKAGGCPAAWLDYVGRLITFAWNEGTPVESLIKAGIGIRCPNPKTKWNGQEKEEILSCPDAIAVVLKEWKEEEDKFTPSPTSPTTSETQSS